MVQVISALFMILVFLFNAFRCLAVFVFSVVCPFSPRLGQAFQLGGLCGLEYVERCGAMDGDHRLRLHVFLPFRRQLPAQVGGIFVT